MSAVFLGSTTGRSAPSAREQCTREQFGAERAVWHDEQAQAYRGSVDEMDGGLSNRSPGGIWWSRIVGEGYDFLEVSGARVGAADGWAARSGAWMIVRFLIRSGAVEAIDW